MAKRMRLSLVLCWLGCISLQSWSPVNGDKMPFVINSWPYPEATRKAWEVINSAGGTPLDAVEKGIIVCELEGCDEAVGYGGRPDENGETTLDAMIMDGVTHDVGAVGNLKRVKYAISVARKVMELTNHSFLVGDDATRFALDIGFKQENLRTNESIGLYKSWLENNCQPNFWKRVSPNPRSSCGPYKPADTCQSLACGQGVKSHITSDNHDTIGMIVLDKGIVAGGTSTNGLNHKLPGRVGDSPISGSGLYVDNDIGGASATGDGDIMMRFSSSYQVVESMRHGVSPTEAVIEAINRIRKHYPDFDGALIAVNKAGEFGAACNGFKEFDRKFKYCIMHAGMNDVKIHVVNCTQ